MKAKKPDKSVAGMAVLKDIRGLLSASRLPEKEEAESEPKRDWSEERATLEAQIREYEGQVRKQQTALDKLEAGERALRKAVERLEAEKRGLEAKLRAVPPAGDRASPLKSGSGNAGRNISELEARKLELEAAVERLEAEKRELEAKLRAVSPAGDKALPLKTGPGGTGRDVSDLEARKLELEAAVSQVDELLQFKVRELTRRIARVYAEAGDMGANRDFRRISDKLEAAESFGEFVRALTRQ